MAQQFPCPNPSCSHVFKAAEVQGGGEVRCPRCGFKLKTGGPAKPAAARPTAPPASKPRPASVAKPANPARPAAPAGKTATPPPKVPIAQPVPTARPAPKVAVAPPAPAPKEEFDVELVESPEEPGGAGVAELEAPPGDGPLIRQRQRRGGLGLTRVLMGIGALVVAGCIVVAGYLGLVHLFGGSNKLPILQPRGGVIATLPTKHGSERIFQLAVSEKTWPMDRDARGKLKAAPGDTETWFHEAWRHHKDDVFFGIVAKDFGTHKPRDAEMVRVAVDKLESLFEEAVEADARAQATKFAGLPAQKLRFKGLIRSSPWRGDCFMFFKSGFAYWFFISSPDLQVAEYWSDELQREDVFSTHVVERRGWREQPAPTENFAATNGAFALTGLEGIWEKHEARNEDERGVLMLFGKYRKEKDNRKNASVLVFTIDKQSDLKEAVKAARADIEAKKKEENTNYNLSAAADIAEGQSESGESADFGSRQGRIVDLCLKIGADPKRYLLVGVLNEADGCYVFRCECPWESRQIWRQDFLELLRSFRARKAA